MKSPIIQPNKIHRPWQCPQRPFYPAVPRREYAYAGVILAARWKQAPPTEALATMAALLEPGSEPRFVPQRRKRQYRGSWGTHAFHLHRELSRLKRAGVTPHAALLTFAAVFVHVWADPRRIGDGIELTYAMTAEVFKLTKLKPRGRRWNGSKLVDYAGRVPISTWRAWGSRARSALARFLMECFEYVAANPQRRTTPQNRKLDMTPEQARIRADRRVRKAFDRALHLPPAASGRNKNHDTIAGMNKAREREKKRKEQQMTEMARREKYIAPPGTPETPIPWDYGDDEQQAQQPTQQPLTTPDGAHVQGATMAPRTNYVGINPAIKAQLDEQAAQAKRESGEDDAEPTEEEAAALAKELNADRNYPLGRARVIGVWRERRK